MILAILCCIHIVECTNCKLLWIIFLANGVFSPCCCILEVPFKIMIAGWNDGYGVCFCILCMYGVEVYTKKKKSVHIIWEYAYLFCCFVAKKVLKHLLLCSKCTKDIWECSNLVQWPNDQSQDNVCVFALQCLISVQSQAALCSTPTLKILLCV